jgi:hypothetical protein
MALSLAPETLPPLTVAVPITTIVLDSAISCAKAASGVTSPPLIKKASSNNTVNLAKILLISSRFRVGLVFGRKIV